jgi:hypothetical protein
MEAAEDELRRENLQRRERMERFEPLIQRRAKQVAEALEPATHRAERRGSSLYLSLLWSASDQVWPQPASLQRHLEDQNVATEL